MTATGQLSNLSSFFQGSFSLVTNYFLPLGQWNMQLLNNLLPEETCHCITSLFLPCNDMCDDQCYQRLTFSGAFTIKSAYEVINLPYSKQNYAWKFQGPQRIRTFIQIILHDALLTYNQQFLSHITTDPWCSLCHGIEETWEHLLRLCTKNVLG